MKKQLSLAVLATALAFGTTGFLGASPQSAHAISTSTLLDTELTRTLDGLLSTDSLQVVLTYDGQPTAGDLDLLKGLGITNGRTFEKLPMVATTATKAQLLDLLSLNLPNLKSIYSNKQLKYFLDQSVAKIGADKVWTDSSLGYTGKGIGVAVLDSGVDGTHPDLQLGKRTVQNVKIAGDLLTTFLPPVYLENIPDTDNLGGHGTHVASTIGGDGSASGGKYKGVAPESNLIGLGTGAAISILYALEGLDYVLANKDRYNIQLVSNSWGTTGAFDANDPINVATKLLVDNGVTVVFAAGNEGPGDNTLNPYAVAPWVISVAAGSKTENTLADFSSRGIAGDPLYKPTVTAPGVDIIAAKAKTSVLAPLSLQNDLAMIPLQHQLYYTTMSGTSMATPHVSGVIALMEQANPNLTPAQTKQILMDTAVPMPGYSEHQVGKGYVDAYAAVQKAKQLQ